MKNSIQEKSLIINEKNDFKHTFWIHLISWLLYLIMQFVWRFDSYTIYDILAATLQVCTWAALFYFGKLYLYPKYLGKNHWKLALWFIMTYPFFQLITIGYADYLVVLKGGNPLPLEKYIRSGLFWYFNMLFVALGFTYYDQLGDEKKKKLLIESNLQKVEIELKNSQLENLKAQFNPHFLFNSLWYIYTLVQGENQKATKAVELLSDMMRYSMQNHEVGELVPLENELNYVNNYIELQRLRNPVMKLDFQVEGEIQSINILPLVLISFVENAFKHGKIDEIENPLKIYLKVEKNQYIDFKVNNKISLLGKERSSGIGLENVKRRLRSTYGTQHTLKIEKDNQYYQTELYIQMK